MMTQTAENHHIPQIGIFSGKGGVGKTSITASLSVLFKNAGTSLLAIDTDVDAPNLAILFHADSVASDFFTVQTSEKASLVEDRCVQCQQCITDEFCTFGALQWDQIADLPRIDLIACEGCHACELLCPQTAFTIQPVDSGTIRHLHSSYDFDVITGETILGSQTSGKLVTELKTYAIAASQKQGVDLILVDGPPGIGCPVLAAMSDLDYILIIIEPTPASLHDAQRLIEVIGNFHIPFGVIINKADMFPAGFEQVMHYLEAEAIELIGTLPVDPQWPVAISEAHPIVSYAPSGISAQQLSLIHRRLQKIVIQLVDLQES